MSNPVASSSAFVPMTTTGTQHLIERTYRESGEHQWVREVLVNAIEAGATRIDFGIEWQSVESNGVYRRVIADDGRGMNSEDLVEFFNTFGGGGKPIGGVHENFGVGSKTSLLPWNKYGMVVISWVDGDASMIWVQNDPESGEYGLRLMDAEDDDGELSLEVVYSPFNDEDHAVNWAALKPEWLGDHGTVIVLLGNSVDDNTVLGDPGRAESDIKGLSSYLNRRLWEVPDGTKITVDELRTQDKSKWPQSEAVAHGTVAQGKTDKRTNTRTVRGAEYFIEYPNPSYKAGKIASSGTVTLADATQIDWYLWDGERPAVHSYASIGGYIGAVYNNEVYDVTSHASTYRSFGVAENEVRGKLWLIIRPPLLSEESKHGVYPRTDRNGLLLRGGPSAGKPLPINDWAAEFADHMPIELQDAIKKARTGRTGTVSDNEWRQRLADRFGSRWKITKLRATKRGTTTMGASQTGTGTKDRVRKAPKRKKSKPGTEGGTKGTVNTGSGSGTTPASKKRVAGGIPHFRLVGESDLGAPGMLAAWQPNDPEYAEGVVLINAEHPVLVEEIEHWQSQYADRHAEDISNEVLNAYGEIAVAKIAHSEQLKSTLPSKTVDEQLRSPAALTMALLGLMGEEAVIAPRIGGKFGRRKAAA